MNQPVLSAAILGLWVAALAPACARSQKIEGLNRPVSQVVRPAPQATAATTHADCERHVRTLRAKVPPGFTVVIEPPFVVLGDESPDRVRQRAVGTVRWACRAYAHTEGSSRRDSFTTISR